MCLRSRCVRGYVRKTLPGANKPQWCNRRLAGPPEGKEGKCKHRAGPVSHPPQAGPGQRSPSGPPFPLPQALCAGLGWGDSGGQRGQGQGVTRTLQGVDIPSSPSGPKGRDGEENSAGCTWAPPGPAIGHAPPPQARYATFLTPRAALSLKPLGTGVPVSQRPLPGMEPIALH